MKGEKKGTYLPLPRSLLRRLLLLHSLQLLHLPLTDILILIRFFAFGEGVTGGVR